MMFYNPSASNQRKKILIGTNYGLFQLDTKTEKITPILPIRGYKVNFISEIRGGDLLIGTDKDFTHYWSLLSKKKSNSKGQPYTKFICHRTISG